MVGAYHGDDDVPGFVGNLLRLAVFLQSRSVRAYLVRMREIASTPIVLALASTLALAGLTAEAHAAHGKIDAFVVREMIRRDLPKINRCYESALRYEPELAGKVKVRFEVLRKGAVSGVRVVENTTGHPGVERCVARVVKGIRFPSRRSGKALGFTFPFVFAPQD